MEVEKLAGGLGHVGRIFELGRLGQRYESVGWSLYTADSHELW